MIKIKTDSISNACECPFYVNHSDGKKRCFIKTMVSLPIAIAMVDGDNSLNPENWEIDCYGKWDNCGILPLLYKMDIDENTDEAQIENFDPFDEDEEEKTLEKPVEKKQNVIAKDKVIGVDSKKNVNNTKDENNIIEEPAVKISVHQCNPYLVEVDVLVSPINDGLLIDDKEFMLRTNGNIQDELSKRYGKISVKIGNVYTTTNGSTETYKSKIGAKKIYHGIVAGTSSLVSPQGIRDVVMNSLILANLEKDKSIAFIPADYGTYDINEAALGQLSAIHDYLRTANKSKMNIKNIYLVMNDKESYEIYQSYVKKIFH